MKNWVDGLILKKDEEMGGSTNHQDIKTDMEKVTLEEVDAQDRLL